MAIKENGEISLLHQLLLVTIAGWVNQEQQKTITFLKKQNEILLTHLEKELDGRRLLLTDKERQKLGQLGKDLGRKMLMEISTVFSPDTILGWYRKYVAQKYDSSRKRKKRKPGRPRTKDDIEALVIKIADENSTHGYTRIVGVLKNLGITIDRITVKNILARHGVEPAPERQKGGMKWSQFIKTHMDVLAATDFFTVDVVTWFGVVTYYVLFFIDLETREVCFAGATPNPNDDFVCQCARQLTDDFDGFLSGKKYLIHDRDTKYTEKFRGILKNKGVEPLKLPARSPNLNAFAERFVLSAKTECFSSMIVLGQAGLWHVIKQYQEHYHRERNHQGIGNVILFPDKNVGSTRGKIIRRDRLGGMLKHYSRAA